MGFLAPLDTSAVHLLEEMEDRWFRTTVFTLGLLCFEKLGKK